MDNERIKLDGRLGFKLSVKPEELKVLMGEDREAAQKLLVRLVQSEHCEIVGDTYFPQDWNEEAIKDVQKTLGLDNFDVEDRLAFDLPEISLVDALKQGDFNLLKNLPCNKGDTVYFLNGKGKIFECEVQSFEIIKMRDEFGGIIPGMFDGFATVVTFSPEYGQLHFSFSLRNHLGKSLFFNKEDAEKIRDGEKLKGNVDSVIQDAGKRSIEQRCKDVSVNKDEKELN